MLEKALINSLFDHMTKNNLNPANQEQLIADGLVHKYLAYSNGSSISCWYSIIIYEGKIVSAVYGRCYSFSLIYWASPHKKELPIYKFPFIWELINIARNKAFRKWRCA